MLILSQTFHRPAKAIALSAILMMSAGAAYAEEEGVVPPEPTFRQRLSGWFSTASFAVAETKKSIICMGKKIPGLDPLSQNGIQNQRNLTKDCGINEEAMKGVSIIIELVAH